MKANCESATSLTRLATSIRVRRYLLSGPLAGALSAVSFALIHALFISNIWFSVVPMMVAGALCGLGIAWSYRVVVRRPSLGSWLRYNALFVAMLALLGWPPSCFSSQSPRFQPSSSLAAPPMTCSSRRCP
jgi:hypothetical protein